MALEYQIDGDLFNGLDEVVQSHYAKDGDSYYLQAAGMSPKSKVDEFRNENVSLRKKNEDALSIVDDLTQKLKTAASGVDKDILKNAVDDEIKIRTKAMTEEYETKLSEMTGRSQNAESKLNNLLVSDKVQREAVLAGVKDTALDDIVYRAKLAFKVVDGVAMPYDGENPIYGVDGKTPQSVKDWLAGQAEKAPHLFKESTGSGAENNKGGGAANKQITRQEFDALDQPARMKFVTSGGAIT